MTFCFKFDLNPILIFKYLSKLVFLKTNSNAFNYQLKRFILNRMLIDRLNYCS